jgi:hypothetical protein
MFMLLGVVESKGTGNPKREWHVLPSSKRDAAIPVQAVANALSPCERTKWQIVLKRNVLPKINSKIELNVIRLLVFNY